MPFVEEHGLPTNSKHIEYDVNANGCWNIISHFTDSFGYAWIQRNGSRTSAHRHVYNLFNDTTIPEELVVRHRCDNGSCINPAHLELGTVMDNMQDMITRGRKVNSLGSKNGKATLTEEIVRQIRMDTIHTRRELADIYDVSVNIIKQIDLFKTWKHVVVDSKYNIRPKEIAGKVKLTKEQVEAILADTESTGIKLAKEYNVSPATISTIRSGKAWTNI